jgi:(p)ppGpp synthase/HD superfamily hydrolase
VTTLTPRFTDAFEYARELFTSAVRKGTDIPYLSHLLAVAALVLEHGGNEDQAIAALLHDAAEDAGRAQLATIAARYGQAVADIVEACSDSLEPAGVEKASWWDRKVRTIDAVASEPTAAALVSAADKTHNARATLADYRMQGEDVWSVFNPDAGRAGTLWYYRRLAELLPDRLDERGRGLGLELQRTVDALVAEVGDSAVADWERACAREAETRAAFTR